MKKEKLDHIGIELEFGFSDVKPIENSGFVKGRCKIAYAGKNRNYSAISKEAFERAEKTLYGCPVVGNWLEDVGNFGGHDIAMESKGNKLTIKDTTVPYGFVPQDANVSWESVEDEYGNVKNYYCADVILWQERYPEQIEFIANHGINQSMEIMVTDGDWDDNWEYFNIDDFRFIGLCLLGRDRVDGSKGDNDVEPCFEQSEIVFGLSDELSAELNSMKMAYQSIGKEDVNVAEEKVIVETEEMSEGDVVEEVVEVEETVNVESDDVVEEDASTQEVVDNSLEEMSAKLEAMATEFESLKAENESLKAELQSLRDFKAEIEASEVKAEKESIAEDYKALLSEDEVSEIMSEMDTYSLEELKAKFACAYAEKSINEMKFASKSEKKEEAVVYENKSHSKEFKKNEFAI